MTFFQNPIFVFDEMTMSFIPKVYNFTHVIGPFKQFLFQNSLASNLLALQFNLKIKEKRSKMKTQRRKKFLTKTSAKKTIFCR